MSTNKPMRALAKSLGFTEREEVLSVPGRGVVAYILFENVDYKRYKDLEMKVEFWALCLSRHVVVEGTPMY
jgi:hypothetical protein